MQRNEAFDGSDPFDWRAIEIERHRQQGIADIQQRCRSAAEQLEMMAGSPHDLIASLDSHQGLFLEAASLLRGYHQSLLIQALPKASGDPTMTYAVERSSDDRTAEQLTAARAHPHCPECRLVLEDCRCGR